jgi:hypothetical protein
MTNAMEAIPPRNRATKDLPALPGHVFLVRIPLPHAKMKPAK